MVEPGGGHGPVRVAIMDRDSGLVTVLVRRLDATRLHHRVLAGAAPLEELVAMRLAALVVDPAILGAAAWDYLEQVVAELPGLALIVCTGTSSVGERVRGLRLGADDWVTKPCHPEELIARIEAVLRRRARGAEATGPDEPIVAGALEIQPAGFRVLAAGAPLELTRREFELLRFLAGEPGRVIAREEIYERVWGYAMAHGDRSVDVFVRKLRNKLARASPGERYVHTHFGIGYRFAVEPAAVAVQAPGGEQAPAR